MENIKSLKKMTCIFFHSNLFKFRTDDMINLTKPTLRVGVFLEYDFLRTKTFVNVTDFSNQIKLPVGSQPMAPSREFWKLCEEPNA